VENSGRKNKENRKPGHFGHLHTRISKLLLAKILLYANFNIWKFRSKTHKFAIRY
jgi:hypothetical protein